MAGAYCGFQSMKQLGVSLLLPGWDASPLQDYPPSISSSFTENLLVPFILLGGEMHCKSCRVVPHIFTLSGSN